MGLTATIIGAVAAVGGAAMQAQSNAQNLRAQAAAANAQAEIGRQQAENTRQIAAQQEADYRRREAATAATFRARLGGTGVTGEGTPLLVIEDSASQAELNALRIRQAGETDANRQLAGAAISSSEAANYSSQVTPTYIAGALSGIGQAASIYSSYKTASLLSNAGKVK
jgi:hypothetical protein